jgi:hypothetical protein
MRSANESRLLALTAALACACLPVDSRAPPGALNVVVRGDRAAAEGIPQTSDGWTVRYERFLVTLGRTWPSGDECSVYSDADYDRVFDARRTDPRKLSLLYALGRCGLAFTVTQPVESSLLTAGVTESDKAFLREPDESGNATAIWVEGVASMAGREKRFHWSYRRYVGYYCAEQRLTGDERMWLRENEELTATIVLRGEALFETDPVNAQGVLRFAPFAEADDVFGNADGEITLEELELAPATPLEAGGTLRSKLETDLFPAVAGLDGATCTTLPLGPPRGPDRD